MPRFRMAALANDPSDFQAKLSYNPEVVILDAMIFKGPQILLPGPHLRHRGGLRHPPGLGQHQ